jgi:hypothetical protein
VCRGALGMQVKTRQLVKNQINQNPVSHAIVILTNGLVFSMKSATLIHYNEMN